MIVVKVELWPGGSAEKAESLGVMCIANRGQAGEDPDHCSYDVELQRMQTGTTKTRASAFRSRVTHYRRKGWLRLVTRAFEALDG